MEDLEAMEDQRMEVIWELADLERERQGSQQVKKKGSSNHP